MVGALVLPFVFEFQVLKVSKCAQENQEILIG